MAERIMLPLVVLVSSIAHGLLRLVGGDKENRNSYAKREELKVLATMGEKDGLLGAEQRKMIHGVLELESTPVNAAMVPLVEMVTVEKSSTVGQAEALAARTGFSRFPVHEGRVDNIVGILDLPSLPCSCPIPPRSFQTCRTVLGEKPACLSTRLTTETITASSFQGS